MSNIDPKIKVQGRPNTSGKIRYTAMYQLPDGKWKSAGVFGSKRLAELAAVDKWRECRRTDYINPKKGEHTVDLQWETVFWPSRQHLAANTRSGYWSTYKCWIQPYLGEVPIGSIGTGEIETWVSRMVADRPGQATSINAAHKLAFSIFKQATRARVIAFNPCDGTPNLPSVVDPDVKVMTPEDYILFVDALPDYAQDMVIVMMETGMRWGELVGLSPRQIDRTNKRLMINQALAEVSSRFSPNGMPHHIKETKGKRTRVIPITQEVLNILLRAVMARGLSMESDETIFRQPNTGTHWWRSDWRRMVVRPALDRAGLTARGYTTKHLRSSHASWLLAGGADLAVVKARLGHHSVTVTEKYLAPLPGAEQKALDAFARIKNRGQGA